MKYIHHLFLAMLFITSAGAFGQTHGLTGNWMLTAYIYGTGCAQYANNGQSHIVLTFKDSALQGHLTGHTFVNDVNGYYTLTKDGKMQMSSFGGTKVYGGPVENKFWESIRTASGFKIGTDTLFIYFNNGADQMVFINQSTLNGKWKLFQYGGHLMSDTATAPPGYHTTTITFEDNEGAGNLSGDGFCNGLSTKYSILQKNKISISNSYSTAMNCAPAGRMKFEEDFIHDLISCDYYQKDGNTLTLYYKHSTILMVFKKVK
jgi:heat shock protein HslJ